MAGLSDCVVQGERRGSWVAVCGPTAAALLYSKKKDAQCVYMCICDDGSGVFFVVYMNYYWSDSE